MNGLPAEAVSTNPASVSDPSRRSRNLALGLAGLVALAIFVGGGGVNAPIGNLAVELAAIGLLAFAWPEVAAFARRGPWGLRGLMLATLLVPLLQLVPLPPALWQGLPGRAMVTQSLDLAGSGGWFAISVDGGRTLLAAISLLAPLAVIIAGHALPPALLVRLQRVVVAIGVAAAAFGSLHLVKDGWGDLYAGQRPMPGVLVSTFADRNGAALFFMGCILMIAGLPALPRTMAGRIAAGGAAVFLSLAIVLTGSRSGMALLALPAMLGAVRLASQSRRAGGGRTAAAGGAVLLALAIAGLALSASGRLETSFARFDEGDGMRAEMREDALFAASRYWPVGAGMGTFDEVFQIDESLEYVSPRRAGRAHMDYIELAIEAGVAGLAVLAGWLAWLALAGWRAVRRPGAWPARAAALFCLGIAAQSLLSFPLRSQAMLCAAAFAIVLLARSPIAARAEGPR